MAVCALPQALGPGTHIPGGLLLAAYQVLPAGMSLRDQARFFARFGAALNDAFLVCWRVKYQAPLWRPYSAIRLGDGTSNYTADPSWEPLLLTPPHPSFPSGHQCASGAAMTVVEASVPAAVSITMDSNLPAEPPRTYPSYRAMIDEIGASRLLGGVVSVVHMLPLLSSACSTHLCEACFTLQFTISQTAGLPNALSHAALPI
jgi:hypothetical protein